MGLFEKILSRLGYEPQHEYEEKRVKPKRRIAALIPAPIIGNEPPPKSTEDFLRANQSWVYACTKVIANEIANIPIKLFQKKGDKVEEIPEHELLDLLYKVNSFTTKFDHLRLTQTYLELAGEAPWFLDLDTDGKPQAIILLRPDRLQVKFDSKTIIGGYTYLVDPIRRTTVELKPQEVILLKEPSLLNPLRGYSTLNAIIHTYNIDEFSEKWNENFFYNSARPDVVVSTDQKLTENILRKLRSQWEKVFRGIKKAGHVVFMHAGLKADILSRSAKDMDFVKQMNFSRDKILAIFGVPKPVLGITEDVNRANAETAAYIFARWTIKPKMRKLVEQLNEFLVPLYGDDLFLDFEDPVPEDSEKKIKEYESALKHGYKTPNEIREFENLLPYKGGDQFYMSTTLQSVGSSDEKSADRIEYGEETVKVLNARNSVGSKTLDEKKMAQITKSISVVAEKVVANNKKEFDPFEYQKFWEGQIKISEPVEREFATRLRKIFKKQEKIVLGKIGHKAVEKITSASGALLNQAAQVRIFIALFKPLLEKLLKKEGQNVVDEFGLDNDLIIQKKLTNIY